MQSFDVMNDKRIFFKYRSLKKNIFGVLTI